MDLKSKILYDSSFNILKEDFLTEDFLFSFYESVTLDLKTIINTHDFDSLEKLIKQSDKIFIVRHIVPDSDAIYSSTALANGIKNKFPSKDIVLVSENTNCVLDSSSLLIVLDTPVKSRFAGDLNLSGNYSEVRIDHHPGGFKAKSLTIELPEAGSTSELITLFLFYKNYKLEKQDLEGLFKGIISDTGRLQYSAASTTLLAMNELIKSGIDYRKIYSEMYVKNKEFLKSKSYILNNYKVLPNGTAYLFLDKERSENAEIDLIRTGEQIYELGTIKGSPIWVIITEKGPNNITMRIRSREIPINHIVELFGGGGHENASGIKVKSRDEAKQLLIKLDNYLGEMKKRMPNLR